MPVALGARDGSRWTPRRLLIAAVHALRRRRYGSARRAIDAAIVSAAREPDSEGRYLLAAACTLFVTGDYGRALDCAAKAVVVEPRLLSSATEIGVVIAELLGWDQEARAILLAALEADASGASWHARLVRVMVRAGAPEEALCHARRALELEPRSPGMALEFARLLAVTGRREAAIAAVDRALELAPAVCRYWRGAADVLVDAGALGAAEGALRRAQSLDPEDASIELELAELALWRGRALEAESHRQAALVVGPELPASWRIRGCCAALAGEWSRAVGDFDRAIEGNPDDYVAYTWRAEAAYRLGDFEGARALLDRAIGRVPGYHPVAWMIRFLVYAAEDGEALADEAITEAECAEFRDALCEIIPEARALFDAAGRRRQLVAFIDRALRCALGNRDMRLTFQTGNEELVRVRTRDAARYASRQALRQIRGRAPAQVLAALDRVVDRFPRSSLPICHRGELHFWLGDLEAGRRDLEAALAINAYTRWAYIGLTGIDIAEGNLRRALQTSAEGVRMMGNTEGPAVFVYRAEAHRLLGDLEVARGDCQRALAISEERLGAWLNLALVEAGLGQWGRFSRVWQELEERAPGLLSDAAAELGVFLRGDPGHELSHDCKRQVVERALQMARGNRSTGLTTYFTGAGRLRFVQARGGAADRDDAERRLLDHALAYLRD